MESNDIKKLDIFGMELFDIFGQPVAESVYEIQEKMLYGTMTKEGWEKEYPLEAAKIAADIEYKKSCEKPENQLFTEKRWR